MQGRTGTRCPCNGQACGPALTAPARSARYGVCAGGSGSCGAGRRRAPRTDWVGWGMARSPPAVSVASSPRGAVGRPSAAVTRRRQPADSTCLPVRWRPPRQPTIDDPAAVVMDKEPVCDGKRPAGWSSRVSVCCPLAGAGMDRSVSVKTLRMSEDPEELVDAIAVAVRAGDDRRIGLLLDRFKEVAGLSHLIRLRERLCAVSVLRG